jgi:hypothetical protein
MRLFRSLFATVALSALLSAQTCPPLGEAPKITSAASATTLDGQPFSFTPTVTGTPAPTVTISGALPAGLALSGSTISGTPTADGTFALTIGAHNATAPDAVQQFTLTVNPNPTTGGLYQPALNTSWQWQIGSLPSASSLLNVQMYDVDGEDASAALVTTMHSKGIKAVCYFSAGTYENWRGDAKSFPASVQGKGNGWPGEKWLDIRAAALKPVMTARIQMCKDKGFDAIEPDNIDGYTNSTGFPLTAADQLSYNEWLANTAHSFGLAAALKNDGDQVKQLVPFFDFDINEQCAQYSECGNLTPFVQANKAVFEAEYSGTQSKACSTLNADNFNGAFFNQDLTGKRTPCR